MKCLEQYDFGIGGMGLSRGLPLIFDLEKKTTFLNVDDNLKSEWKMKTNIIDLSD